MTTILNGLLGGLLTGTVASVATSVVDEDSSVTAALLKSAGGPDLTSNRWMVGIVQVAYGGLAGGILVALELFVLGVLAVPPTSIEAFGVAIAWSTLLGGTMLALWGISSGQWGTRSSLSELLVYHLVYGLGLGVWIRLTWIT